MMEWLLSTVVGGGYLTRRVENAAVRVAGLAHEGEGGIVRPRLRAPANSQPTASASISVLGHSHLGAAAL